MNNNEIHLTLAKRGAQLPPNYEPAMVQSGKVIQNCEHIYLKSTDHFLHYY